MKFLPLGTMPMPLRGERGKGGGGGVRLGCGVYLLALRQEKNQREKMGTKKENDARDREIERQRYGTAEKQNHRSKIKEGRGI